MARRDLELALNPVTPHQRLVGQTPKRTSFLVD
jgi:hypothetical protein